MVPWDFPLIFFFFNDTATTEIYTLSLHDALPISYVLGVQANAVAQGPFAAVSMFLVTSSNPTWAVGIGYVAIALMAILGAMAAGYTLFTGGRAEAQEPASDK